MAASASASTTGEANTVAARAAAMMVYGGVGGPRRAPRMAVVVGVRVVAVAVSSVPVHIVLELRNNEKTLTLTLEMERKARMEYGESVERRGEGAVLERCCLEILTSGGDSSEVCESFVTVNSPSRVSADVATPMTYTILKFDGLMRISENLYQQYFRQQTALIFSISADSFWVVFIFIFIFF